MSKLFSNWTEIGVQCLSSDHSRWDCCKTNIHRTGNEAVLLSSWMLVKGSAITLISCQALDPPRIESQTMPEIDDIPGMKRIMILQRKKDAQGSLR